MWTFAVEHRATAGTVIASALRVGGGIVAAATVTITAAGAGRVYLGVHWATDVVTGWLLGAAWVALCAVVLLLAERTFHNPQGVQARGPGFEMPSQTTTTGQGANSTSPRLVDPSIPSTCGPRKRPTTTARAPAA